MSDGRRVPASIDDMIETIGVRPALKLVQVFGGLEVSFPAQPSDTHPVILALGKEDGYAICKYMGGGKMSVPHCRPRRSTRSDIVRLEAEGLSAREIARRLGITQRWVRMVTNGPPPLQFNLFQDDDDRK